MIQHIVWLASGLVASCYAPEVMCMYCTHVLGAAMHPFSTSKFTTDHTGNVLRNLSISFKMHVR